MWKVACLQFRHKLDLVSCSCIYSMRKQRKQAMIQIPPVCCLWVCSTSCSVNVVEGERSSVWFSGNVILISTRWCVWWSSVCVFPPPSCLACLLVMAFFCSREGKPRWPQWWEVHSSNICGCVLCVYIYIHTYIHTYLHVLHNPEICTIYILINVAISRMLKNLISRLCTLLKTCTTQFYYIESRVYKLLIECTRVWVHACQSICVHVQFITHQWSFYLQEVTYFQKSRHSSTHRRWKVMPAKPRKMAVTTIVIMS